MNKTLLSVQRTNDWYNNGDNHEGKTPTLLEMNEWVTYNNNNNNSNNNEDIKDDYDYSIIYEYDPEDDLLDVDYTSDYSDDDDYDDYDDNTDTDEDGNTNHHRFETIDFNSITCEKSTTSDSSNSNELFSTTQQNNINSNNKTINFIHPSATVSSTNSCFKRIVPKLISVTTYWQQKQITLRQKLNFKFSHRTNYTNNKINNSSFGSKESSKTTSTSSSSSSVSYNKRNRKFANLPEKASSSSSSSASTSSTSFSLLRHRRKFIRKIIDKKHSLTNVNDANQNTKTFNNDKDQSVNYHNRRILNRKHFVRGKQHVQPPTGDTLLRIWDYSSVTSTKHYTDDVSNNQNIDNKMDKKLHTEYSADFYDDDDEEEEHYSYEEVDFEHNDQHNNDHDKSKNQNTLSLLFDSSDYLSCGWYFTNNSTCTLFSQHDNDDDDEYQYYYGTDNDDYHYYGNNKNKSIDWYYHIYKKYNNSNNTTKYSSENNYCNNTTTCNSATRTNKYNNSHKYDDDNDDDTFDSLLYIPSTYRHDGLSPLGHYEVVRPIQSKVIRQKTTTTPTMVIL